MSRYYIDWTDDELEEAGIDKQKLQKVMNKLSKAFDELDEMGLWYYAASTNSIMKGRAHDDDNHQKPKLDNQVATFDTKCCIDGGDW